MANEKTPASVEETDTGISADTDNLDDFEKLWHGEAKPAEPVEEQDSDGPEDDVEEEVEEETDSEEVETTAVEDDEDGESEEDDDTTPAKPSGKQTAQERISELTGKWRSTERERDEALAELARLKAAQPDNKSTEQQETPAISGESSPPDPDAKGEDGKPLYPNGEYDPKYIADLTRYTLAEEKAKMMKEMEAEREQAQRQAQQEQLIRSWEEKVQAAVQRIPDLLERTQSLEEHFTGIDPQYGEFLATTIMQMDNGPDILYHFSQNPEQADQIVNSGPAAALMALGRMDAQITAENTASTVEATPKPKVSKAPAPPPTRTRGSTGKHKPAPDTDDLDAFMEHHWK